MRNIQKDLEFWKTNNMLICRFKIGKTVAEEVKTASLFDVMMPQFSLRITNKMDEFINIQ